MNQASRPRRKTRIGIVTSNARDKTVTVQVRRATRHPRYDKIVPAFKNFHAHDENNESRLGDRVRIVETRPLSKTKRWRVAEIVERAR